MKTTLPVLAVFLFSSAIARADDNSYAMAAYSALTTETVIVFGPVESCDAPMLAELRKAIGPTIAPSLKEIGYACVSHDQIKGLNPPVCVIVGNNAPPDTPPVWVYTCYPGIVDRLVRPPPTAAALEQRRKAQEAAQAAQQQATARAAEHAAERMVWQRRAVDWAYQQNKAACMQKINAHRAPGQDDPGPLCDRAARNNTANSTMDLIQYCAYMRSTGQPESNIHAACDAPP
jgi:hypothetical protein